jgi:hypothetical protein
MYLDVCEGASSDHYQGYYYGCKNRNRFVVQILTGIDLPKYIRSASQDQLEL